MLLTCGVHFHALNGERLTCFDAYESLLHRT